MVNQRTSDLVMFHSYVTNYQRVTEFDQEKWKYDGDMMGINQHIYIYTLWLFNIAMENDP